MQTQQPDSIVPIHPNVVELASLLENKRLKSAQRKSLQRALRSALGAPADAQYVLSPSEPTSMAV